MNKFSELVMFGSLLFTPLLFLMMPVRRAMITAYCVLWMFLPVTEIRLPGFPTLTKPAAISVGVLIAVLLFYADLMVKRYRFMWFDVPVVLFALFIPFFSAFVNDLGVKASLFEALPGIFLWIVPYFAGRIILGDELGVQELAAGIFFAALIYVPLAWFEMIMSPQLHMKIYGAHQHEFKQTIRGWSYRPMVFMAHGLMTSMWLVAGAVCGSWLLYYKRLPWKWGVKPIYPVGFLAFTAAVSNSMGAVILMVIAFIALLCTRKVKPAWVLLPLLLFAPFYIVTRSTGVLERGQLVSLVVPFNKYRADSLDFRLKSEDAYVDKALEHPMLGWGGEGRHRPRDPDTRKMMVADGLWIIVLGKNGLLGLVTMTLTLLAVPTIVVASQSAKVWRNPRFAATGALTVLLVIYMIDNLLNAMINPIYMLASGALASFATQPLTRRFALGQRRRASQNAEGSLGRGQPPRVRPEQATAVPR